MSQLSEQISKSLGSENSYAVFSEDYDPTLLNPLPRKDLREENKVDSSLFFGADVWHCHESTFLLNNGVPIAGTTKIVIPETSPYLPESKSMKLFFNSFDMCKLGDSVESAIVNYETIIRFELNKILFDKNNDSVGVKFFPYECSEYRERYSELSDYEILEKKLDLGKLEITNYQGKEEVSFFEKEQLDMGYSSIRLRTNVLRSRCRHTKQKDTGSILINLTCKEGYSLNLESLYKYIVSFREVNEFHEMCCEKMFHEIFTSNKVKSLSIQLLYSRRGSLDINPVRSNNTKLLLSNLISIHSYTSKEMCQ